MDQEHRASPFECQRCWYVWEEEFLVRKVVDRHGDECEIWTRSGVIVQAPPAGATCPECGCQQVTLFPAGYLARHPELLRPETPAEPDPTPLLSPVPRRIY